MCGICGFIDKNANYNEKQVGERMVYAISHRGPDCQNVWVSEDRKVTLAHARLSIIDLSESANQPFFSSDGSMVIIFNGEIYNFLDIKKDLILKGHVFRTTSDTEVIIYAVKEYGIEKALRIFNGMFAFCLYDLKDDIVYLARDRIGKKPLFYANYGNKLIFGSELKSLFRHPEIHKEIDPNSVSTFLRYSYIHSPETILKGVQKLPPASYLVYKNDNAIIYTYWDLYDSIKNPIKNIDNPKKYFRELLEDSVKIRMISDVPIGAFLSGGIDSSLVVALMQSLGTIKVKTFSIGFDDKRFDESKYAEEVANILGCEHTTLFCTDSDSKKFVPDLPKYYDEPFADPSQIPTLLLSQLTRNHVTVALSGDGGDELFGGYDRYYWMNELLALQNKSYLYKKMFSKMLEYFDSTKTYPFLLKYTKNARKNILRLDRLYHLKRMLNNIRNYTYLYQTTPMSVVTLRDSNIINYSEYPNIVTDETMFGAFSDLLDWMMFIDQKTYMVDDILQKVDRASMGFSLECRNPFLDYRILNFSWSLPRDMKFSKNIGKIIMRNLLAEYIPERLIKRPKQGFSVPLFTWLKNSLNDFACSLIYDNNLYKDGILNKNEVHNMWRNYMTGDAMFTESAVWAVLMYLNWRRFYNI